MRNKIATIHIYEGEIPVGSASRLLPHTTDEYEIVLSPHKDEENLNTVGKGELNKDPGRRNQTILAHELGHVVAQIYKDPSHSPFFQMLASVSDDNSVKLPAENQAWKNAHEIDPALDPRLEEIAKRSYKENM